MDLSKLRKWRPNNLLVAFFIPFFMMLVLMICVGSVPFGTKSLLYSDMWHQYFPFFKAYRQALLSGESFLYSWNVGMGMDYLGLISYYLASPLYLLSVLLPESWVLPYFCLLVPVKLGFASLFFAYFLKKIFNKNDISIALFGSFYGLCTWALGYQWNIMWLDTFALLPLVALGTVHLLRDQKFILYTVTLALSILINYYIGFFTCIFVLLLFICYQICRCKSWKRFFLDLCRIALFSALAIGMTAIMSLPALSALGKTYSSVNSFPDGFSLNIVDYEMCAAAREAWEAFKLAKEAGEPSVSLWFTAVLESFGPIMNGMGQVAGNLAGGNSPTFMEGLPNVYTGVSTLILAFMFLMAGNVKLRDKLCCIFLLLFLMISFIIRQLDYIWHGFHFTNQIPYRFSFIFSFIMLYMAYRAYLVRHRFRPLHFALAGLLTVEIFLLSKYATAVPDALSALKPIFQYLGEVIAALTSGNSEAAASSLEALKAWYLAYENTYIFLIFNGIFIIMYLVILIYPCLRRKLPATREARKNMVIDLRKRRRLSSGLLVFALVLELGANVVIFGRNFQYTELSDYPQGTKYTESMIRYMQEREDSLFYRAEVTHTQTLNDGAMNNYNGISTFTSSANVKVTRFMKMLGYSAEDNWNRYLYEEASPVANLFLNLKYMLEREGRVEDNPYFESVHSYGDVYLLENKMYLPLGFLADSDLAVADVSEYAGYAFSNQNALFTAATGIDAPVWNVLPGTSLTVEGEGVNVTFWTAGGYCDYNVPSTSGTVVYRYEIESEGLLCLDVTMNARNYFHLYHNGNYLYSDGVVLPQTYSVCQVKPGDVVEIRANCAANEISSMNIQAALLDDAVFNAGYQILNSSTLELTEFSTARVAGDIYCNRDGLLYTSIPDDGNWKAYVDGEEATIVPICDAMIGLELTQGSHEIVFVYHNQSFTYGILVTVGCLLIFLALIYRNDRERWNERVLKIYKKLKKR